LQKQKHQSRPPTYTTRLNFCPRFYPSGQHNIMTIGQKRKVRSLVELCIATAAKHLDTAPVESLESLQPLSLLWRAYRHHVETSDG
jgi:hypothetical protein